MVWKESEPLILGLSGSFGGGKWLMKWKLTGPSTVMFLIGRWRLKEGGISMDVKRDPISFRFLGCVVLCCVVCLDEFLSLVLKCFSERFYFILRGITHGTIVAFP